jgi:hypothetical protein
MKELFKITNGECAIVIQPSVERPDDMYFYIREDSTSIAATYLSPTQVQELINHLTNCLNTIQDGNNTKI